MIAVVVMRLDATVVVAAVVVEEEWVVAGLKIVFVEGAVGPAVNEHVAENEDEVVVVVDDARYLH